MSSQKPIKTEPGYASDDDWQEEFDDAIPCSSASSSFRRQEPVYNNDDSDDETPLDASVMMASGGLQPPVARPQAAKHEEIDEEILFSDDGEEDTPDVKMEDDVDEDWLSSDEIETSHVVVDLHGFVDQQCIEERAKKGLVRVRHPMSENPILQLQGQLYSGKYRESDGSIMIMQKKKADPDAPYELLAISNTILDVRQSFIFAKGNKSKKTGKVASVSAC
uniref:TFIIIC_sub6 domain-containing protein n=1 Tax=Panagrellus redivivus TaxID=6233 RepID=A0A7E4VBL7_PANRE